MPGHPEFDFSDTSALVTGGTSGIGRAVVSALAGAGAKVVFSGRDAQRGEAICDALHESSGEVRFVAGDITDSSFCASLVSRACELNGDPDLVVNSAGVIHHATVEETTDQQWSQTFDVNVAGMFYVCRAVVPRMRCSGGGVIVNIASDAGLTGSRHLVAYCASKGAVIQMTRAMAVDHGPQGIRVVAVCPGDVDTEMLRGEFKEQGIDAETGLRESAQSVPLRRVCSAEEVADLVLYAASPSARFMTGFPLVLDGGSRA